MSGTSGSEPSDSVLSGGEDALDSAAGKRIKRITDVATEVSAKGGRGKQKIWKCAGILKKSKRTCGYERKGGQTKMLAHCLSRHKPDGARGFTDFHKLHDVKACNAVWTGEQKADMHKLYLECKAKSSATVAAQRQQDLDEVMAENPGTVLSDPSQRTLNWTGAHE
eukprot:366246-Chlamydomonas_euryale.AAC.5